MQAIAPILAEEVDDTTSCAFHLQAEVNGKLRKAKATEEEIYQRGVHPRHIFPHGKPRMRVCRHSHRPRAARSAEEESESESEDEESEEDEVEVEGAESVFEVAQQPSRYKDLEEEEEEEEEDEEEDDDGHGNSSSNKGDNDEGLLCVTKPQQQEPALSMSQFPHLSAGSKKTSKKKQKASGKRNTFIDEFGSVNFGDVGEEYHVYEIMEALPMNMQHKARLALKREMRRTRGCLHWTPRDDADEEEQQEHAQHTQQHRQQQHPRAAVMQADAERAVAEHTVTLDSTMQLLQSILPVDRQDADMWAFALELRTNCQSLVAVMAELLPNVINDGLVVRAMTQIQALNAIEEEIPWWREQQ